MLLLRLSVALWAVCVVALAQDEGAAPPVEEMTLEGSPEPEPEPTQDTQAPEPAPAPVTAEEAPDEAPDEAPVEVTDEEVADEPSAEEVADEPPAEEEDASVKALEARLADQQEEIATLRRQLEESQRQSEQLEEVVTGLESVEVSVDDFHAFEQQRAQLAERRAATLIASIELLADAGRALYYGSDDVLPELESAGATLDGEARQAALMAAEFVRRGDLFTARSWVDLAHTLAEQSLQAEGGVGVNVYP